MSAQVTPRLLINGAVPNPKDFTYRVLSVDRSANGGQVDQAVIEVISGEVSKPKATLLSGSGIASALTGSKCAILHGSENIHFGLIDDSTMDIGDGRDKYIFTSRIQPAMYGPPIVGCYVVSEWPTGDWASSLHKPIQAWLNEPIIFNGYVDDHQAWKRGTGTPERYGNRTAGQGEKKYTVTFRDGKDAKDRAYLLVPHGTITTLKARDRMNKHWDPGYLTFEGVDSSFWTLRDAVEYLCAIGNTEKYIKNPEDDELKKLPRKKLPRTEVPDGMYLTQTLDWLLGQWGFRWFVKLDSAEDRSIGFFEVGKGAAATLSMPNLGEPYSGEKVRSAHVTCNQSKRVNAVHILGGYPEYEGTFELYRVDKHKWALNEAGDYSKSAFQDAGAIRDFHLEDLFTFGVAGNYCSKNQAYRRRQFLPMLTLRKAIDPFGPDDDNQLETRPLGDTDGIEVEIIDPGNTSLGGEDWKQGAGQSTKNWVTLSQMDMAIFRACRVLQDECGIVFEFDALDIDGEQLEPFILTRLGADARVRVTATIRSDSRVQVYLARTEPRPASSPNTQFRRSLPPRMPTDNVLVWDALARFPVRRRIYTGPFRTKYHGNDGSRETKGIADVREEMESYARRILDATDEAVISGHLTFVGAPENLQSLAPLGGIVKEIGGREITLQTNTTGTPRYPNIVAQHWDFETHQARVDLSTEPPPDFLDWITQAEQTPPGQR